MNNALNLYYPSATSFPSVSTTGDRCSLNCSHCKGFYLKKMVDASATGLYETCRKLKENDAKGALISGGSDSSGAVFVDCAELEMVADIPDFILNVHCGLISHVFPVFRKMDAVSVDFPPSDDVIKRIYHLDKTRNDYVLMLEKLEENRINYLPHLCIGLDGGKVEKEFEAIEILENFTFKSLVILTLKPTPGIPFSKKRVKTEDYEKVIKFARDRFDTLCLGCMRERARDKESLWHYFDKIAWPSRATEDEIFKSNIKFEKFDTCCAV
ncbi:MAG: hypothetical protein ACXQTP_01500 [Candidatus Methanofastidiosia archaeon]